METLRSQDVYDIPEKERRLQVFTLQVQFPTPSRVDDIMAYSDSLFKVKGVMARVLRASLLKDKLSFYLQLSADDYARATYFLKKHSMIETHKMVESNGLATFAPFTRDGLYYTKGCLRHGLQQAIRVSELLILSHKSRLAFIIMTQAHCYDHRSGTQDTLWRSRQEAWIIKGKLLAKKVVSRCSYCKTKQKKLSCQIMAELPKECVRRMRPFFLTSLDLTGPYEVRAMVNARAKRPGL